MLNTSSLNSRALAPARLESSPQPPSALIDRLMNVLRSSEQLAARMRKTESGIEAVQRYSAAGGSTSALISARLAQLTARRHDIAVEMEGIRGEAARLCIP